MRLLKSIWKIYKPIAQTIGNFMGQLIMTIFYLIILLPLGLIMRLFSDPLNIKTSARKSNFGNWEHPKQNLEGAKKQY